MISSFVIAAPISGTVRGTVSGNFYCCRVGNTRFMALNRYEFGTPSGIAHPESRLGARGHS
jgi:hypothetical protein